MNGLLDESWLPQFGLSYMECAKASNAMALFVTLAAEDEATSPEKMDELLGCFVIACVLSSEDEKSELKASILTDLKLAGMEPEKALELSDRIGSPGYYNAAFGCRFIRENRPDFGLHKNSRGIYINERKFVKKLARYCPS
jgi:hypothetical protein